MQSASSRHLPLPPVPGWNDPPKLSLGSLSSTRGGGKLNKRVSHPIHGSPHALAASKSSSPQPPPLDPLSGPPRKNSPIPLDSGSCISDDITAESCDFEGVLDLLTQVLERAREALKVMYIIRVNSEPTSRLQPNLSHPCRSEQQRRWKEGFCCSGSSGRKVECLRLFRDRSAC